MSFALPTTSSSAPSPSAPKPRKPRPTLLALPKELLTLIASHLPTSSDAISLLLTHRSLRSPSETRLWRDLDLTIPKYFGETILVRPQGQQHGSVAHCAWAKGLAKEVEMKGRAETRRKVESVILALGGGGGGVEERKKSVRKVVLQARVGANNALVQLLSFVREYVREIEVKSVREHIFEDKWKPKTREKLWTKLLDFGLNEPKFTKLTRLSIEASSGETLNDIMTLLRLADRLTHLSLTVPGEIEYHQEYCECEACSRAPRSRSQLGRHLNGLYEFSIIAASTASDSFMQFVDDVISSSSVLDTFRCNAPILDDTDGISFLDWAEFLADPGISSLDWRCGEYDSCERILEFDTLEFSLEHLVISGTEIKCPAQERIECANLPGAELSVLRTIVIETSIQPESTSNILQKCENSGPFDDDHLEISPIHTAHMLSIHGMPNLEIIQFVNEGDPVDLVSVERWEQTATHGIVIRVIRLDPATATIPIDEDDDEVDDAALDERQTTRRRNQLYHIRTYTTSTREEQPPSTSTSTSDDSETIPSDWAFVPFPECETDASANADGGQGAYFSGNNAPHWEDATHFQGEVVPLWLIAKMRKVDKAEGREEKSGWAGLRVKVGEKAWKVLVDWREGVRKEKQANVGAKNSADRGEGDNEEEGEDEEMENGEGRGENKVKVKEEEGAHGQDIRGFFTVRGDTTRMTKGATSTVAVSATGGLSM